MKKVVTLLAAAGALLVSLVSGPLVVADDTVAGPQPGFRSYKWGDPPPKDAEKKDRDYPFGGTWYTIASEKMTAGKGSIQVLDFGYFKGRLYSVVLSVRGRENCRALFEYLRANWGPGERGIRADELFRWSSDDPALGRTEASYFFSGSGSWGRVEIRSARMSKEAEQEQKAKDAKGDR